MSKPIEWAKAVMETQGEVNAFLIAIAHSKPLIGEGSVKNPNALWYIAAVRWMKTKLSEEAINQLANRGVHVYGPSQGQ